MRHYKLKVPKWYQWKNSNYKLENVIYLDYNCKIVNFCLNETNYLVLVHKNYSILLDKYQKKSNLENNIDVQDRK